MQLEIQRRCSSMDQEWSLPKWHCSFSPLAPFLLTSVYTRGKQDQLIIYTSGSYFFSVVLKILTNKKTKLSLLSKVSAVLAGLNLKCSTWSHVILWFYCMSKAFQPTLVCLWSSYMSHLFILQLLKGMSDVFFWSSCKKVTGPYFTLPLESRRLTHAKCSFQSFVLVISTQAKESVSDKLVDCLLFLTLVKEIVKCTRNMFWKLYYFLFFLKHK